MVEINPSWKQLERVPECAMKAEILKALGIERGEDGWSRVWQDPDDPFRLEATGTFGDNTFVVWGVVRDYSTRYVDGSEALRLAQIKARGWPGSPIGDALRAYLRRWGWVPKNERRQPEPQENTKTII